MTLSRKGIKRISFREGKATLRDIPKRGSALGVCATFNRKYLCCNVHVLRSVQNCPFECTYCFLQNYLTDGAMKVVRDVDILMEEVRARVSSEPWRLFRIGTWELGDSLALEQKTGQAEALVRGFAEIENAMLELKTKSDRVETLLGLDHRRHTVVSWSLNTDEVIRKEEHRTARLLERLKAMKKVSEAGYLIGLHFDPMIIHDGWQRGYRELVEAVFDLVSPGQIAWISIGSLRFNPEMKKLIENNYPDTDITSAEMILGDDNKIRYVKPLRVEMYRLLYDELKSFIREENLVYLCMERWDMWERVLGWRPDSIGHLDYIFAESMHRRFGIMQTPPERKLYEESTATAP